MMHNSVIPTVINQGRVLTWHYDTIAKLKTSLQFPDMNEMCSPQNYTTDNKIKSL